MAHSARNTLRFVMFASAVGAVALSTASCSSCAGKGLAKSDLTLVPREADFVLLVNVDRARDTGMWRKALDLRDSTPEMKARYDEIAQRTGIDVFKDIKSVFVAFPATGTGGEFGVVVHGGPFEESRVAPYAREQLQKQGAELLFDDYSGHHLYTDNRSHSTFVTISDKNTLFIGGKEWIRKMLDLAAAKPELKGQSAADNTALADLIKKTRVEDAIWGVGVVPEAVRAKLKEDQRLASAGTMKDVFASLDFQAGFALKAAFDLGGESDATALATRINAQIADARHNPQMMMLGLSQYFDSAKVASQGATFLVDIKLTQQQVEDLVGRLKGLMESLGGAGAGGGMGMPGGGMPMPPGAGMPPGPAGSAPPAMPSPPPN